MEIDEVNFQELGRRARAVQDRALSQLPEPSADERLVAIRARRGSGPDPERSRPGTKKARAVIGGIAAAAFLCVGAWLLFLRAASLPLSYEVEGSEGELGQWLGSDDEPISLRFSEGSAVDLRKGARARVTATSRDGATISLERGSMRVDVVHRASTRWLIAGGPFEVHVLGTEFEVAWDTATEELRVDMMSGSVRVEGPCIASNTRVVSAPESLRVRCSRAAPVEAPSVASAEPLERPALDLSALPTEPAAPPPSLRVPTWRAKLAAGEPAEALLESKAAGLDGVLAVATANELLELGSAARLAGDSAAALRFYQQVRSRFPESDAAAVAAYHFGRMAFGRGSWSDAERWFGTYLAERPGGALAAEALGRSLECAKQRGDVVRIKLLASRYLETYPRGPHAPLAEQLLTESAP